jgi:hypothetical protein
VRRFNCGATPSTICSGQKLCPAARPVVVGSRRRRAVKPRFTSTRDGNLLHTVIMMTSAERTVALLATAFVCGVGLWRLFVRWFSGPPAADPWGPELTAAVNSDEAIPLCPRCQSPHADWAWFCPECGAAVGLCNNVNPYLYVFSLGEVLRTGTQERFRANWLTLSGYVLLALCEYNIFAPVYWFLLFRNFRDHRQGALPEDSQPQPSSSAPA